METKKCSQCGVEKNVDQFHWRNKSLGRRDTRCTECKRGYWNQHRRKNIAQYSIVDRERKKRYVERNKSHIVEHLMSHPCVDCGETDMVVLTFDHVRGKKKFNLCEARDTGYSAKTLQDEIDKCEVRCHNCHNRRTAKEQGWWILEYARLA
jgi:hypothetical protein